MSKMRHNDIVIPIDGSDAFLNCKLDRKQYAEVLTSIVNNYKEGFVLAINNKWGTGKTTFVKMWQQHLKNNDYQTLYFNAWENDFQEEVIIALLSELEELREKDQENFDKLLAKTATFLKKVTPAAIKGAVSKVIGDDAVGEIAAAAMEFTTEEVEQHILTFNEKKKGITDFRNILEKFVDKVDNDKPVVFIIDELDRCRPDYAVKVLEQIKHLFAVPGIVFVLSIDKIQLSNAIKGFYGSDSINADEYLRRFIDLEYVIPKPDLNNFLKYLYDYFDFDDFINQPKRKDFREFNYDKDAFFQNSLSFFSNGYSLRQVEKVFARIRLTIKMFRYNQYIFPHILVLIAYLQEKHSELYQNIKSYNYTIQELVDKVEPILIPIAKKGKERVTISLLAVFLKLYQNGLLDANPNEDHKLAEQVGSPLVYKISFDSKFEGQNKFLSSAIEFYNNNWSISDLKLSFVSDRFDLMQNIVS